MSVRTVGVLHPGAMGASLIRALRANQHKVLWLSNGRSPATADRADNAGALACDTLGDFVAQSEIIISVCPPESAVAVAETVSTAGFDGLFVDVNAISPQCAAQIGELFPQRFVDGGVIGPPAHHAGTTRLYLSGARAEEAQALFSGSLLEAIVLPQGGTAGSALKMCYASWSKGQAALLLNTRALAETLNVGESLETEWQLSQPGLLQKAEASIDGVAPKAWRFSGEMKEIAQTYAAAGLPEGFHLGAAEFYELLAEFKNAEGVALSDMLRVIDQQLR